MHRMSMVGCALAAMVIARVASAGPGEIRFVAEQASAPFSIAGCEAAPGAGGLDRVWQIRWTAQEAVPSPHTRLSLRLDLGGAGFAAAQTPTRRPVAVEYSHGYEVRQKIHKYASIATIPLFIAETWVGQSMYNDPTSAESKRGAHGALAASIGVLFGVNSVTGVWNLAESRKNPAGRTRRTVHGILMLAADAGFVATGLLAPDEEGGEDGHAEHNNQNSGSKSTHRAVALTSMGVALASYLMMLIWKD